MTRAKISILFTVAIDVLGFGIVIPILPYYVREFGASPSTVTILFASFSLCSFLSAPFLGALSDRWGRRPVLILSILSTAIGWFVFAGATSIPILFLGRVIDGIAAGNFVIAQSYMVDISRTENERTANLGLVSAVFGTGFLLGPMLGGTLSKVSHAFPFWMAGLLASLNCAIALLMLPESHTSRRGLRPLGFNPLGPLRTAILDKRLRLVYGTWLLFALAFVTGQSVFALFAMDVFGFSAFQTGMAFAVVGMVVVLNQTLLLKRFWVKRFVDMQLVTIMLTVLGIALLCIASEIEWLFYVSLVGLGTGQAVLRVVITSQVAGASDPAEKGEKLGILSALMSFAMVVAPVLAGTLFEIDHAIPYVLAALLLFVAVVPVVRGRGGSLIPPADRPVT